MAPPKGHELEMTDKGTTQVAPTLATVKGKDKDKDNSAPSSEVGIAGKNKNKTKSQAKAGEQTFPDKKAETKETAESPTKNKMVPTGKRNKPPGKAGAGTSSSARVHPSGDLEESIV